MITSLFMDPLGQNPLLRSFRRHLYAENRSARTPHHLIALRQAGTFLRGPVTSLDVATQADLEASWASRSARAAAAASSEPSVAWDGLSRAACPS